MNRIAALMLLVGFAPAFAHADANTHAAEHVPAGWEQSFDYASSLNVYLHEQAQIAKRLYRDAYVYFFSDEDPHCMGLRKTAEKPVVAKAFDEARIVMLSFDYFKQAFENGTPGAFDVGTHRPFLVKLSSDGRFTGEPLYVDLYLYHLADIPEDMWRRRAIRLSYDPLSVEKVFADRMTHYFNSSKTKPKKPVYGQRGRQH